jgi:plastocyanin
MSASPTHYRKPATRCVTVLTPFLRHLNTGTLAFALVIALAPLTSILGNEPETKGPPLPQNTKTTAVIDNFSFSPKTFPVPAGATVAWTNHDSVPHVVTSVDDQFKKSPVLKTDQRFSNTFATAGTYSYFCSIHPPMTEKIVVK